MIAGLARLAAGVWNLAGRALGAAGDWLRRPRDWWRLTAVCMGVVCVGFAFAVQEAKREVILVREQCQTRVVTIERQAAQATTAATTTRRALQQCKTTLADEVGKAVRAQQMEREATAAAAATAARAERDRETWQRRYQTRPATCRAALEALESACPSLSDF